MTAPDAWARMMGAAYFICISVPPTWMARVRLKSSSDRSSTRPPLAGPPALLTRMSRRPKRSRANATDFLASASSATSASTNKAPVDFATSSPRLRRRPLKTTDAPSSRKRSTIRRPIPLVPPVTRATFPCSRFTMFASPLVIERFYGSGTGTVCSNSDPAFYPSLGSNEFHSALRNEIGNASLEGKHHGLNDARGLANLRQQTLIHRLVDFHQGDGVRAGRQAAEMECSNIHLRLSQQCTQPPDKARLVPVGDVEHGVGQFGLDRDALDLNDARLVAAEQGTGDVPALPVGRDGQPDQCL